MPLQSELSVNSRQSCESESSHCYQVIIFGHTFIGGLWEEGLKGHDGMKLSLFVMKTAHFVRGYDSDAQL